jgi:magnesium transporter
MNISACRIDKWIPDVEPAHIHRWLDEPQSLLWVDVEDPREEDFQLLQKEFNFHPLAIEDVQNRHQRPKIDTYEGYDFIVFYAVRSHFETNELELRELEMFVGHNYIVTVHDEPIHELKDAHKRWKANVKNVGHDTGALLYSILDTIMDDYFPALDAISDKLEDLEAAMFGDYNEKILKQLLELKRKMLGLRRIVGPQRDVINILLRGNSGVLPPEAAPYLQDLYDHSLRVVEQVDTYREMVTAVAEGFLSVQSNNLNEVMRRLTVINVLFLPLAVLTGFFGMNFEYLPFDSPFLLEFAILAMIAFPTALYLYLRRKGWG